MLPAAEVAREQGSRRAELFSRCLFPALTMVVPPPAAAASRECEVQWWNKPASGKLEGLLFTDGSAIAALYKGCSRAGWAIVSVTALGEPVAAAYGAVPWEAAFDQSARDGEDYCYYMLARLTDGLPQTRIFTDCLGTVEVAQAGSQHAAEKSASTRTHLWKPYFRAFDGGLPVKKVLAHSSADDVLNGNITFWERAGNQAADRFAKRGARLHGLSAEHLRNIEALNLVAKECATWAAWQGAELTRRGWADTTGFSAKQLAQGGHRCRSDLCVIKGPLAGSQPLRLTRSRAEELRWLGEKSGHAFRAAVFEDKGGGCILFCGICGSYNSQRASSLLSVCKGKPAARTGKAQQLHRLQRGFHPSHEERWRAVTLAEAFTPSASQLLWLYGSWVDGGAGSPHQEVGGEEPEREDALAAFGQTSESLQKLVATQAAVRRATARLRRQQQLGEGRFAPPFGDLEGSGETSEDASVSSGEERL